MREEYSGDCVGLLKMSLLDISGFPLRYAVSRSGESLALQRAPSQSVCNACIEVSKQAEQVLSEPQTLEYIEELARSICTTLPSNFSSQCDEMAKTYTEETIAMLQDYLSKDNLCSRHVFVLETVTLIQYFTDIGTVDAKEFCQKISFCQGSASLFLKQQQNCDLCRAATSETKSELKDPETKLKVIEVMLDSCKRVPAYAKECKKLVFEYGPIILTNMEKYLDSNDVCSKIYVCEPLAGKVKGNMDFISLPVCHHWNFPTMQIHSKLRL